MSDMTLIPTGSMGTGGDALAAGLGAFVGAGVSGNGGLFGNNRNDVNSDLTLENTMNTNTILTSLNQLQQGQNAVALGLTQGQNVTNTTVERAAASTFTGLTAQNTQSMLASASAFAGVGTAIVAGTNATLNAIGAADRDALTRSFEAQLAAQRCCCETNANISREAEATRALMRDQFATSQAVLICDLKSQNQALQFQISQQLQTAEILAKLSAAK